MAPRDELYAQEIERHALALREALVRHDENIKAHTLMQECMPYFLLERPAVVQARSDQAKMVEHLFDPAAYERYYKTNAHERPFEDQYGLDPKDAHTHLHRVGHLRTELRRLCAQWELEPEQVQILDVSANDGWMAVNLHELGYRVDCVDLNPSNCELARRRMETCPGIKSVHEIDLHELVPVGGAKWDVVVCFETLEHVADPHATLTHLATLGRVVVVSTPVEAIEQGNVPYWFVVEPKGHVRAVRREDLKAWCARIGTVENFATFADRTMAATVRT
jgi:2-polyprenyl-3-methyl-5-hydroxy-6-metoxy-1,4-benzoquinol methylase